MTMDVFVHEATGVAIITVVAIAVLLLADLVKRRTTVATELTRKLAHIGSGVAVLLIPAVVDHSLTVLVLAASFAGLMLVTYATGLLGGVHGVGRGVGGVLWYPMTAWIMFVLVFDEGSGEYLHYAIPVLVLACADAMGAVVGKRWGRRRYEVVPGHFRSAEGSLAFFVVATTCVFVPLATGLGQPPLHALAVAMLVAVVATAYEGVSVGGLDNLLVPFGTLLFFQHFVDQSWLQLGLHAVAMLAVAVGGVSLRWRRPATGGGYAAFTVCIYTVMVLGGWAWVPPLAALVAAFVIYDRMTPMRASFAKSRFELGTAVIGLTLPVILVLLHGAVSSDAVREALYAAFLANVVCQAAVLAFMLPQHHAFRWRRVRRVLMSRAVCQHRPTIVRVVVSLSAALALGLVAVLLVRLIEIPSTGAPSLTVMTLACTAGLVVYITLATTCAARRTCDACGTTTLHGLTCCTAVRPQPLVLTRVQSLHTLTFRRTYLVANAIAASTAGLVVLQWNP